MAQVPIIQMIYLDGVLAAFATFAITLLAVSLYAHRHPHHRPASVATETKHGVVVVRGVRPLYF